MRICSDGIGGMDKASESLRSEVVPACLLACLLACSRVLPLLSILLSSRTVREADLSNAACVSSFERGWARRAPGVAARGPI